MKTGIKRTNEERRSPAAVGGPRGAARPSPVAGFRNSGVQTRLAVRSPGDHLEQQADLAAARVVDQWNNPAIQLKPSAIPKGDGLTVPPATESELTRALQGGRPLEEGLRSELEGALGADFEGVKIHTGSQAQALSQSLQARAFTAGQHIFFGAGQYDPSRQEGRRLLAHELTHVIQQGNSPQAIQRVKIAGKPVGVGMLAFQIGGDRFGEVMDILNGPLKDGDYLNNEAAKQAVDGILASCDVYSKKGSLRIQGTGSRCNTHLAHSKVVAYFRKQREEITEGEEQSLTVGEGKTKKNKLYGQIIYSNADGLVKYWHAHDAGKMG